jgi:hypothetical protein
MYVYVSTSGASRAAEEFNNAIRQLRRPPCTVNQQRFELAIRLQKAYRWFLPKLTITEPSMTTASMTPSTAVIAVRRPSFFLFYLSTLFKARW